MWYIDILDYRNHVGEREFGRDERDWQHVGPFQGRMEAVAYWRMLCDAVMLDAERAFGVRGWTQESGEGGDARRHHLYFKVESPIGEVAHKYDLRLEAVIFYESEV